MCFCFFGRGGTSVIAINGRHEQQAEAAKAARGGLKGKGGKGREFSYNRFPYIFDNPNKLSTFFYFLLHIFNLI